MLDVARLRNAYVALIGSPAQKDLGWGFPVLFGHANHLLPLSQFPAPSTPRLLPTILTSKTGVGFDDNILFATIVDEVFMGVVRMQLDLIHSWRPDTGCFAESLEVLYCEV